jgi:predicted GIY-YIG superfamily endonuclease
MTSKSKGKGKGKVWPAVTPHFTGTWPPEHMPHYVYRLFDVDDNLLYVGCSYRPDLRLRQHRGRAPWAAEIATVRHTVWPTRSKALEMERKAIAEEDPRHNKAGRKVWRIA